ncbi:MAG: YceI family protein [Bacteroidota bacterium]
MKKFIVAFSIMALTLTQSAKAQMYTYKDGSVSFFSKTAMEDIDAHNTKTNVLLQIAEKKIAFIAYNTDFKFVSKLMEEHYNEKYVESEKFPMATFLGKINEDIDLTKEGVYNVTVTGNFTLHGVVKERTIPGTITVKSGEINVKAVFPVTCGDHKIIIPTLVVAKVSEKVDVTVNVNLVPKK